MKTIDIKEFLALIKSTESSIDIQNTKEIVSFGASLCVAGKKSLEDGAIDLGDARYIFGVIGKINPAFKDIKKVRYELADLQEFEIRELTDLVFDELGEIGEGKAKVLILKWLNVALEVFSGISMTLDLTREKE